MQKRDISDNSCLEITLNILQISEMEIGLAVGGAFLSSALNVLFDRLAPHGDLLKMFRKRKNDVQLLKKLKLTLLGLQAVLSDAENKQASNQSSLKLKVEGKHQNLAETLLKHCRFCNLCLGDHSFLNINDKLKKTIETLEVLENQIGCLGLQEHFGSTRQETRTPSTCLVDESDIFGRHKEIKDLIDRLLSEDASGGNLTVVPIVGMGGAGKTTLAKVVYNSDKLKDHFRLKAWYCVSEPYDALRITKGLLQGIGSFDSKDDGNLNQLQVKLKESLKGKKFLVVLDDVWNDTYSEWDNLRNVFVQGDMGSKIIVTTRKESVAQMMCADRCAITVGTLSSEDSWDLFKRHSLENRDHPELEEVGKKIADKCKGLPLALKALAGVLRGKSDVDEWRNILRSEIWEQQSCWNGILPALMLSYNDLPAHLKQCFAFCAIYPKDYEFCKDQAIYLWIANGLVKQFCLGNKYFDELRSRSLFERVPESEWESERFLMHDLINDLAQTASSKLCIRLEENEGSDDMLEQSRHMSYSMGREGDFEKLKQLSKSGQLRTLLPVNITGYQLSKRVLHNILPSLTSLRALSLSGYDIEEFPNDLFVKFKLLRFLDLSWTHIGKLPDSICALYNLETLLLSNCWSLEELPLQMENLINLRHLDLSNTSRLKMPLHLSKLKSLQVLVGNLRLGGLKIEDLGELENLYGSLSVLELQNVVDQREALKAKLKEKNHVENLSLEWSESSTAEFSQTEIDILDGLRPHTNIKEVEITGYRGTKFSNWLADPLFLKLVKLSLSYCKDCYSLPALGELPSLKILCIRGMHGITEVKEEFYRSSSSNKPSNSLEKLEFADMPEVTKEFYGSSSSKKPFNSLEKLEFKDMLDWKHWHVLGCGEFPKLEKLSIEDCPKLMGKLPENLCSLTELKISKCPQLNLDTSQLEGMKQIVELKIGDCDHLTLPFSKLPSTLKKIRIYNCKELKLEEPVGEMFLEDLTLQECVMSPDQFLPRARTLRVRECHNLTRRFLIPTATETLTIMGCEDIEKLSVACGGTQMTSLSIEYCKKLTWLPERMQELLPSLKRLKLWNCPDIESFPEGGLPFNLEVLEIDNCKKLVNGRKEWLLPRLRVLQIKHDDSDEEIEHEGSDDEMEHDGSDEEMEHDGSDEEMEHDGSEEEMEHDGSDEEMEHDDSEEEMEHDGSDEEMEHDDNDEEIEHWKLPSSIQSLTIRNLKTVSSEDLKSLTSLEYLRITNLPQIQSLLEEGRLPSSLSELHLWNHDELHSLHLSHLTSLLRLHIGICPNLQSLSESALPSSLSQLTIWSLQSLSELELPSSLSQLKIRIALISNHFHVECLLLKTRLRTKNC
ncbi:hypothetical protein H5410_058354 [Solanum commersonii]|uniref:NB-ARC domain-containing protein n=1 Tax=Solanum commersonii TaxID=4109 RepID=A0A9J5WSW1_SOLCO|nr:hypothetical protein H5410_058354 [Solanum commersonii]